MAVNENKLYKLSDLDDYKVASDDPDVRGWHVISSDGTKIGDVDELIVDPQVKTTRYLDVKINESILPERKGEHLLIPIGAAKLHEENDEVYLDGLNSSAVLKAPVYTGQLITRDYEDKLRSSYWPGKKFDVESESKYYENDIYREDRFYGSRRRTR